MPCWTLLSHVYKLFSARVITNRLVRRLDDFQPPEQAGFRKGFSTVDHIHTLRQVILKTEEYTPLCLAFVDYKKAFDSISDRDLGCITVSPTVPDWLSVHRGVEVLVWERHYVSAITESDLKPILLERGVSQGDVISLKLFTAALEDIIRWNCGHGCNHGRP